MPRVLVIDDQPHVRATISIALLANGFEVVAVDSARAGLREQQRAHFDLAMVDIYMPDMDGVQLIKAFRTRAPSLPVIAMSGVFLGASERTVLDILPITQNLSDIVCLQKPFRSKALLFAVQKALGVAVAV
jgi:DNA-binding NtrC family response regulator